MMMAVEAALDLSGFGRGGENGDFEKWKHSRIVTTRVGRKRERREGDDLSSGFFFCEMLLVACGPNREKLALVALEF